MIKVQWFYWLCAAFFAVVALRIARDAEHPRRVGSTAFWGLLAFSFAYGSFVSAGSAPAWLLGVVVIAMAAVAGAGRTGRRPDRPDHEVRRARADRYGNRLFVPALTIPVVAVLFGSVLNHVHLGGRPLLQPASETLIGLGVASVLAVLVACVVLRPVSAIAPVREGQRLLEAVGWATLLPQMLATLGLLFTQSGVGAAVGRIVSAVLPSGSLIAAVVLYCLGMALFTIIMGNAFAAFPIMTAAIGWPVLVQHFGGNPAPVFAIGMLSGFCGTLCTPMAANFNLVPAALLEMKDQYGPIKAQIPTAVPLWACNVALMYVLAF